MPVSRAATLDQHLVAGVVTEAVVDVLKAVEISEQHRYEVRFRRERARARARRSRNNPRVGSPVSAS